MYQTNQLTSRSQYPEQIGTEQCVKSMSVAEEIAQYAERLANIANKLSEQVNMKLAPIMREEPPNIRNDAEKSRMYPPLFSNLRQSFAGIESALNSIGQAIERTEL